MHNLAHLFLIIFTKRGELRVLSREVTQNEIRLPLGRKDNLVTSKFLNQRAAQLRQP